MRKLLSSFSFLSQKEPKGPQLINNNDSLTRKSVKEDKSHLIQAHDKLKSNIYISTMDWEVSDY